MARSSILGGERAPQQPAGRDADALGPSDSSDSGSDIQGEPGLDASDRDERYGAARSDYDSDTDASGTGERGSALGDEDVEEGQDISPDHIESIGPDVAADENDVPADRVRSRGRGIAADDDTQDANDDDI